MCLCDFLIKLILCHVHMCTKANNNQNPLEACVHSVNGYDDRIVRLSQLWTAHAGEMIRVINTCKLARVAFIVHISIRDRVSVLFWSHSTFLWKLNGHARRTESSHTEHKNCNEPRVAMMCAIKVSLCVSQTERKIVQKRCPKPLTNPIVIEYPFAHHKRNH